MSFADALKHYSGYTKSVKPVFEFCDFESNPIQFDPTGHMYIPVDISMLYTKSDYPMEMLRRYMMNGPSGQPATIMINECQYDTDDRTVRVNYTPNQSTSNYRGTPMNSLIPIMPCDRHVANKPNTLRLPFRRWSPTSEVPLCVNQAVLKKLFKTDQPVRFPAEFKMMSGTEYRTLTIDENGDIQFENETSRIGEQQSATVMIHDIGTIFDPDAMDYRFMLRIAGGVVAVIGKFDIIPHVPTESYHSDVWLQEYNCTMQNCTMQMPTTP